jgi:hypothetical protein
MSSVAWEENLLGSEKAKSPGAHFEICLPLADIKRLSEDFVDAKYGVIES